MLPARPLALAAAVLSLTLAACSPPDPQHKASAALADGVLLPAYAAWADADRQLAESAAAFCAGAQDLPEARQAFLAAQRGWSALQPLQLGPLAEGNLAWQVQFWPDKKNLVARQVEELLTRTPQLSQADLDQGSVVVQGLSAYEYVLFDRRIELADAAQKARYCPLLVTIGAHQQALSAQVLEQWQTGLAEQFKTFPNARYADAQEAIADLLRTQVSAIDGLKKKLATPLGRQSKGVPQPFQAEGWRSQTSLSTLDAGLASAERLWLGAEQDGLRSLLGSQQHDLAERVGFAYSDTRQRLAALRQPLGELLASEPGRTELNALYDSLNRLHRLQEGELAKALGIPMGFNAHDGD